MRHKKFKEESVVIAKRVPKSKKDIINNEFNKIVSKYESIRTKRTA